MIEPLSHLDDAPPVTEDYIHSYVDGSLSLSVRKEFEAYLAEHPEVAERVTAYRDQNIKLQALAKTVDGRLLKSSVRDLKGDLQRALRRQQQFRWGVRFAAATLLVGLVLLIGWRVAEPAYVARHDPVSAFTRSAADAHILMAAEDPTLLRDLDGISWLSRRVRGRSIDPPNLEGHGLALISNRIVVTKQGLAAQATYRDGIGDRLTFYLGEGGGQTSDTLVWREDPEFIQVFWTNTEFFFSLVGNLAREALSEIAEEIQEEFASSDLIEEAAEVVKEIREELEQVDLINDAAAVEIDRD